LPCAQGAASTLNKLDELVKHVEPIMAAS